MSCRIHSWLVLMLALAVAHVAAAQAPLPGIDDVTSKSLRQALISEAVLIVYGTGADPATTANLANFSERLKERLKQKMEGGGWPITVRADSDVSLPELGGCALFLVGTAESNIVLTLYEASFPVQIDAGGISVGRERVEGENVAATFSVVNPFNPGHYAVIYTGVTDEAIWNAPEFTYDEIGYVLVTDEGVQARGQFDTTIPEYWTALPGASVTTVAGQLQQDTKVLGIDFQPEEPIAGLDGKEVFLLGHGPQTGTADAYAFLLPYLIHLQRHAGVRMVAIEAPLWLSDYLDAYVVDGSTPPDSVTVPAEMASFLDALREYNRGLSKDARVHVATFDLNGDVFESDASLLPLKTRIGQLRDRETRKSLSAKMAEVTDAYAGGNPAAMLQAVNRLNEAVALAALKKKLPAEIFPQIRRYLDTEKTSIFYQQPEIRDRRDSAPVVGARGRILRENMTAVIRHTEADLESPVLFFLAADHCNKGAPGPRYGVITLAEYFHKYYDATWEGVHSMVAYAYSGGYYDPDKGSLEALVTDFTPDEFEAQVARLRQPESILYIDFSGSFWADNRLQIDHTWTRPAELYDGMVFFFDVRPLSGDKTTVGQ